MDNGITITFEPLLLHPGMRVTLSFHPLTSIKKVKTLLSPEINIKPQNIVLYMPNSHDYNSRIRDIKKLEDLGLTDPCVLLYGEQYVESCFI